MADSCATCFFFRNSECHIAPPKSGTGIDYAWPHVQPTDWCGAGMDSGTSHGFTTGIATPGTGGLGFGAG